MASMKFIIVTIVLSLAFSSVMGQNTTDAASNTSEATTPATDLANTAAATAAANNTMSGGDTQAPIQDASTTAAPSSNVTEASDGTTKSGFEIASISKYLVAVNIGLIFSFTRMISNF